MKEAVSMGLTDNKDNIVGIAGIKYEVSTGKPFTEAVASLVKSLEEQKFSVMWKLDFNEKLKEKGIDFEGHVTILEACNPHLAKAVLSRHPDMGYFLPCKLVIYVQNGSTHIGMLRPGELTKLLQHADIEDIAREVESLLVTAIERAI